MAGLPLCAHFYETVRLFACTRPAATMEISYAKFSNQAKGNNLVDIFIESQLNLKAVTSLHHPVFSIFLGEKMTKMQQRNSWRKIKQPHRAFPISTANTAVGRPPWFGSLRKPFRSLPFAHNFFVSSACKGCKGSSFRNPLNALHSQLYDLAPVHESFMTTKFKNQAKQCDWR